MGDGEGDGLGDGDGVGLGDGDGVGLGDGDGVGLWVGVCAPAVGSAGPAGATQTASASVAEQTRERTFT